MGMFDEIAYESICPVCHNKVDGFQSKDRDCILDVLRPQDVDNFYTHCETCGVWVEFDRVDKVNFNRIIISSKNKTRKRLPEHDKLIAI